MLDNTKKYAVVLGSGAWGTALASVLYRNGYRVTIWSYFESEAEELRRTRENPLLKGLILPDDMEITCDKSVASGADLAVLAVPSFAVGTTAEAFAPYISEGTVVCNVAKGLCEESGRPLSELVKEKLPGRRIVTLSGPSLAEEVAMNIPTAVVAASSDERAACFVQDAFSGDVLRVYVSGDELGVQLGGAVKNVIALCAGISDGLGMGDNTKAALITRGMAEITRLGVAMGAEAETFSGLSCLGDLAVTCMSMHSRNHRAGILIGQGTSAQDAVKQVGTVEGYYAAKTVAALAKKHGVEMPITEECCKICFEGESPKTAITRLMSRPKKQESILS
ncbi:MAG: NAD(P)-dependent glycerol-3-phosphate dehydrogenase [Clostridia bacterium]|nr:NAD(P)-dependent glycerol-3-phosphate dehydrogenase [Clostridia bacterium]